LRECSLAFDEPLVEQGFATLGRQITDFDE